MNEYDTQAANFLTKHGITFSFKLANTKTPNWNDEYDDSRRFSNHFLVSFKKGKEKISFDFFDSMNNFQKGVTELRAYDALTCCSAEFNCPNNFEEFCDEFGYDQDSRSAEKTFRACLKLSNKLKKFFVGKMADDLMEIC